MQQYPPRIKRLIRQYADQIYEAELAQALSELEQQFAAWHNGQITAGDLSQLVFEFSRGPAREHYNRYRSGLDDMHVAYAITTGILKRDELPEELLSHLQRIIAFYERDMPAPEQDTE